MKFLVDIHKERLNRLNHGVSLHRAAEMDFATALFTTDDAQDYGELREVATGFLAGNLYVLVFSRMDEERMRVISLRRASASERKSYAEY